MSSTRLSQRIRERLVPAWFVNLTLGILREWADQAEQLESVEGKLRRTLEWIRDWQQLGPEARRNVNDALCFTGASDRSEPRTMRDQSASPSRSIEGSASKQ